jgi:predicted RNA-binding protein Jag
MPDTIQNQITKLIYDSVDKIALVQSLSFEKEGNQTRVCILTQDNQLFLENQCEVLEAIQHYIRKTIHIKNPGDRSHFFLDIGYYNKNREYILSVQTPQLAQELVLSKGRTVIMTHLSGFERLLVHNILAGVSGLQTTSVGAASDRKLLIIPSSEIGSSSLDEATIFDLDAIKVDLSLDMFNSHDLAKDPELFKNENI